MLRRALWSGVAVCALPAALLFAWLLLARTDFFYPLWYRLLAIDATVAEYGPQNRNRAGFERTDAAEHRRLFAAMVTAIHDQGRGLETLRYRTPDGRALATLLTEPEIVHLRDVARLVDALTRSGWLAAAGWLLLTLLARRRPGAPPRLFRLLAASAAPLLLAALIALLAGPTRSFYQLHRWLFPPDHQWFFYYRDSLMTTLMQAPKLFAPIALCWLALTLLVLLALLTLSRAAAGARRG